MIDEQSVVGLRKLLEIPWFHIACLLKLFFNPVNACTQLRATVIGTMWRCAATSHGHSMQRMTKLLFIMTVVSLTLHQWPKLLRDARMLRAVATLSFMALSMLIDGAWYAMLDPQPTVVGPDNDDVFHMSKWWALSPTSEEAVEVGKKGAGQKGKTFAFPFSGKGKVGHGKFRGGKGTGDGKSRKGGGKSFPKGKAAEGKSNFINGHAWIDEQSQELFVQADPSEWTPNPFNLEKEPETP